MHKKFFILLLLSTVIVTALVFQATRSDAATVILPQDLAKLSKQETIFRLKVAGRVQEAGLNYQIKPEIVLFFTIANPQDNDFPIPVVYKGLKPDMFAPGRDVIIEGDFVQGTMMANSLLTQCPSKYEPPVPGAVKTLK